MAKKCLADLKPEEVFIEILVLRSKVEPKKSGAQGPNLKLSVFDGTKKCKAKLWNATDLEVEQIFNSDFLMVSGCVDRATPIFPNEVTIKSYKVADNPDNMEPFLSPFPEAHEENSNRFKSMLKSVREPNLSQLLRVVFDPAEDTWKQFKKATAAQSRHHAYRGGLLEHSVEVAELCDNSCRVLPYLRRDFLVTCALLHDIGKLQEMDHGLAEGEFTEAGTLVSHTASGAHLVGSASDKVTGFPNSLKMGLMHMVLSHHGSPEWGAAQVPACAEAFVLHECDNMSAKAHHWYQAFSTALPGQFSVKASAKEYYYVGDFGLQPETVKLVVSEAMPPFVTQPKQIDEAVNSFVTARMPIKALVAAGLPDQGSVEEEEEIREVVPPACGADFLVRVTGDSMADEGIREQDLLFVKEIDVPKDGDIVVAHLGASGEVVKRFRFSPAKNLDSERKWLESENSVKNYPDLPIDNDTRIRGKVVGLLRDF